MTDLLTIAIATADRPEGWLLINAADFDPELHQVYDGPPELDPSLDDLTRGTALWDAGLLFQGGDSTPPGDSAPGGPLVEPSQGIGNHNLTQLRALASTEKIPGRSGMERDELLEALQAIGYEL